MSWAEEQDWFGLEDQALEALYGSDYDIDSETLNEGIEFMVFPAWRMRNGKLIAIKDMDTSHIKHCIKMIYESNGTWKYPYLKYFKAELITRKYFS